MHLQAGRPDLVIERCAEGMSRLPADEHWATGLLSAGQGLGHLLRGELDAGTIAAHRGLALEYELGDSRRHRLRARRRSRSWPRASTGTSGPRGSSAARRRCGSGSAPGTPARPRIVTLHRLAEQAAQDSLGEERYWQLRERAAAAPLEEIIRLALADADHLAGEHSAHEALPPRRPRPGRPCR